MFCDWSQLESTPRVVNGKVQRDQANNKMRVHYLGTWRAHDLVKGGSKAKVARFSGYLRKPVNYMKPLDF